jgi:8-oxo-dGTP pyrophosphatase MutT (NUDIX family)
MSLIDRVGAVFLLRSNDGASLLQLRDDKPGLRHARQWVPPGGHAKFEEEIDACARREFLEETGYNCTHLYKLHELNIKEKCFPPYILTIFWEIYDSTQTVVCNEGQDLKFIGRHEISKYSIPDFLIPIWDNALKQAKSKGLIRDE